MAAHPEHRQFVYPTHSASNAAPELNESEINSLYGRDGKLKNPQRSFYYDKLFNPFGAPPPGLPYRERGE